MHILLIGEVITLVMVMATVALTDVPQLISFQGKLYDGASHEVCLSKTRNDCRQSPGTFRQ